MSAVTTLPLRSDCWTVDDLDLLPDDWPYRYELALSEKYAAPGECCSAPR